MSTRGPATRDQVDAYRFGLRRMETALVRGDPVPLHEQLRSQRRAAVAGALVGMLAVGGVAIWAQIAPRPTWSQQDVVVGSSSGAMYVVAHEPDRLVPVANLPAGRLVLAALRHGGAGGADPAAAVPVLVDDADLDAVPRTPTAAVPGATAVRLGGAVIGPRWAVCDAVDPDSGRDPRTTVVGGAEPVGPSADAVLLAVRGGDTWLVSGGVRHRIDLADRAVVGTLGLDGREPRAASAALLNALPEGAPLRTPRIAGAGTRSGSVRVGDVLVGRPAGDGPPTHHVVLAGGAQAVPPLVAQTLRAAGARLVEVEPAVLTALGSAEGLDVAGWPDAVPPVREVTDTPVVCAVWSVQDGAGMLVGSALPVPPGTAGVDLAQADGAGELADAVVLSPGGGGTVRATGPGRAGGSGPLWLVSASGVAYGVADSATAEALGVTTAEPAPEWAVRLLPVGGTLDLADAQRTVDVLPG